MADGAEQNAVSSEDPMTGFVLGDSTGFGDDNDTQTPAIADEDPLIADPAPIANGRSTDWDSAAAQERDDEEECAAVTQWRAEYAKRLEETLIRERQVKKERSEQAVNTIEKMYKRWDLKRQGAEKANLQAEDDLINQRDAILAKVSKPGGEPNWNVVPELVDMSGTFKEGARDTSRMRQVLMRMKTH